MKRILLPSSYSFGVPLLPLLLPLLLLLFLILVLPVDSARPQDDDEIIISNFATHDDDESLYDENGKLSSFLLVYPLGEGTLKKNCLTYDLGHAPVPGYNFKHAAVTGKALETVFPSYKPGGESGCLVACLEVGTDISVVGHTMPHQHYDPTNTVNTTFQTWFSNNCHAVQACITNYYNRMSPLTVYWIHPETGERFEQGKLPFGLNKNRCFNTYIGHSFQIEDELDGMIEEFTVNHSLFLAIGESPPSGNQKMHPNIQHEIERTLKREWNRHLVAERTFSPLGFAKGRLPPDVFASMGAFYYNNRHNKVREEWNGKGVFVNWWESDVYVITPPWELKEKWQIRLRDMVSEWAGVPVEQTIMYGMRQYEQGARLLTHVDRLTTHAVSMIVNVAQGNMTEPWPVEVFDHADRLHEVLMEPGDVVYYESAKNLHSRNRPLNGQHYVNLFTHYRPEGDGDSWHSKKLDQPGVPPPVLETKGECKLKTIRTTTTTGTTPSSTAGESLAIVQQVHCDDPRLGNTISPTFFEAKTADDLVEWWRRTGSDYIEPAQLVEEVVKEVGSEAETDEKPSGKEEL